MWRSRLVPYLLIAPSLLFLMALFAWPLAETTLAAFTDDSGYTLSFIKKMASDSNFRLSLKNTILLVVIVVPLQIAFALGLSMLLSKIERGRFTYLYIWTIPLGISDLAAGLAWLAIFTERGYLNSALNGLGLISGPANWMSYQNPVALFLAIVVAEIWRATPIVLVIVVAGLGLIPKEYDEAAKVFGASAWKRFIKITLPLLKPSLQTALILRTVMALEVFAMVFALAGRDFPILVGEAYQWQNLYQSTNMAAAYALLILVLSIIATVIYLRVLRVPKETLV